MWLGTYPPPLVRGSLRTYYAVGAEGDGPVIEGDVRVIEVAVVYVHAAVAAS